MKSLFKMDNDHFESMLKSLTRTQHKRRLLQILEGLRKVTNQPENIRTLHTKGYLKYVVACLQQESKGIVDSALSVLGNCSCLDGNCAKSLVQHHGILGVLSNLLDKFEEDSIKGRIFRILGNVSDPLLCQIIIEKEAAVLEKTSKFLLDEAKRSECPQSVYSLPSEPTITMAIRVIRKLATSKTINSLMTTHKTLNTLGCLLIKYAKIWEEKNTQKTILNDIIKTLLVYSDYKHNLSIEQLKNTDLGNAFDCFHIAMTISPERVVKITINLLKVSTLRSNIPIEKICENLMENIRICNEVERGKYLKGLCKIVQDPCCREEVKNVDVIPFLIGLMRQSHKPSLLWYEQCHHILSSLISCRFDSTLIAIQIKSGIIEVLIGILKWIYGSSTVFETKHKGKKRRKLRIECNRKRSKSTNATSKKERSDSPLELMFLLSKSPRDDRCASPSSSSDVSSTPNSPNYPSCFDNEELSDSDNYSPVCSDNEETEHLNTTPPEEKSDSDNETVDYLMKDILRSKNSSHFLVKRDIQTLIDWYATIKPRITELSNPQLVTFLTKAAVDISNPLNSFYGVVLTLLSIQEHLLPIMQSDYIPMVYDLTIMEHDDNCYDCVQIQEKGKGILYKLTALAESGCGKGDIAHQLLRGEIAVKKSLILVIPFIIKSKVILSKLMLNCSGLALLMKLLQEENTRKKTIKGICALAVKQLKIKSPSREPDDSTETFVNHRYALSSDCSNIVIFKLDDGSRVKADRDFLSEKCDYFNRLLSGDFKESQESEIALRNVSGRTLQFLLTLLYEDVLSQGLMRFSTDLDVLLDVIVLADKFILIDLAVYLTECVEKFQITSETVPSIYRWSIESGTNILRVEAVAFALVGDVEQTERHLMFQQLFDLGYSDHLVDDIKKLLTRFLK